jgi:hypothetical protein
LVVKNGFEQAGAHLPGHAAAGVGHGQPDARPQGAVRAARRPARRLVGGGNGQPAPLGHGITGVDRQVDEHLRHLPRVHRHRPQAGGQVRDQADVLADQPPQHVLGPADHRARVHHHRAEHLLAAEREQLPRQLGGPAGGLGDGRQRRADRVGLAQQAQGHLGVPEDDGQQVVEVVGDAAGEPADRLHLLRLPQLLLEALVLGHVAGDADDPGHRPVLVAVGGLQGEEMPQLAGDEVGLLIRPRHPGGQDFLVAGHDALRGVGGEQVRRAQADDRVGRLPDHGPLVGAVGRLAPEKGFDLLVRAFDRLARDGIEARLVIAGEGDDRPQLEALVAELGLGDRVRLLGYRGEVVDLYEAMDAFALSSLREGLPNVVLEAMAMEEPVVATRVAGVPAVIADGVAGLLVTPGSADELAGALRRLLADPVLCGRPAREARDAVRTRHSFARRMDRVRSIYDRLLGGDGRSSTGPGRRRSEVVVAGAGGCQG